MRIKLVHRIRRLRFVALTLLVALGVYYATSLHYKRKHERTTATYLALLRQVQDESRRAAREVEAPGLPLSIRQKAFLEWLADGLNYQFGAPERIALDDVMHLFGQLMVRYNDRSGGLTYAPPFRQDGDAFDSNGRVRSQTRPGRDLPPDGSRVKRIDLGRKEVVIERPLTYYQYVIENRGAQPITAPVLYNHLLWNSTENIVSSSGLSAIENQTERALALWRFVSQHRYHFYPVTNADEEVDVVKFLSVYGYGWCGESALVLARLAEEIGLRGRVWVLQGHVVPEVFADGKWIMLDPDRMLYFHAPGDPRSIYGIEELSHDRSAFEHMFSIASPKVRRRLQPYLDDYIEYVMSTEDNVLHELNEDPAGRNGYGRIYATGATSDYRIDITLRPGEKVVFANYNWGRYFFGMFPFRVPKYFNGYFEYRLPLTDDANNDGLCAVSHTPSGLTIVNRGTTPAACIEGEQHSSFPIVGGEIRGGLQRSSGRVDLVVRDDANGLISRYGMDRFEPFGEEQRLDLGAFFGVLSDHPTYRYTVALEFQPGASVVIDRPLTVRSDFQFSETALLALSQGVNRFNVWALPGTTEDVEVRLRLQ